MKKWPFGGKIPHNFIPTNDPNRVMVEMSVMEAKDFYENLSRSYFQAAGLLINKPDRAKAHAKAGEILQDLAEQVAIVPYLNKEQRKALENN